jgi:hypothetical protein
MTMRKTLGVVFALALLLPVGALAQTSTSTATSTNAHRAALEAKLAKIKDVAKRTIVERIDSNVADLNKRMTDHFANVLDQIQKVLARVTTKTDKVQADGKDVTMVRAKITAAQTAIATARTKVAAQAAKTYTINVTTENGLRGAVQTVRKALHDDLMAAQATVKAAREAVRQAIVTLASVAGEATSTGTTSSTNQ